MSDDTTTHKPDPTARTLATLHREIENLQEQGEAALHSFQALTAEKFASVQREFDLLERGRVEQKADTKQAVDAALIAQKEAVKEQTLASEKSIAKSEAATAKQIEQQSNSFNQGQAATNAQLADLKDRVIKIESVKQGVVEQKNDSRAAVGTWTNGAIAAAMVGGPLLTAILMKTFGL